MQWAGAGAGSRPEGRSRSTACASLAACTGKDPYRPGTPLGTFHVDGKLYRVAYTKDAQPFHIFPENVPTFAGVPGR